jgi:serine/threonine protein kinase
MTLSPGTLLNNRYRILSILGQGGMGAVYHAIDENLGVAVAVKENLFLTDEYARQFQREASILAGLRHPNLPRVGDYFTLQGQGQYLIMDYIEGEDVRMRLERLKQLPEKDVVIIGVLICDALAYMNSRKPPVVHRDIKPGNIKVTPEGEVILVDFGLAKIMSRDEATTTGARAMTPGYSPPEQYGTARTDPRSDIYSLGATLYAALTALIPEDGLARATGKVELTPIRSLLPKVNRRLAATIEKALEVEPEQRYQTADEFRNSLLQSSDIAAMANIGRITIPPPPLVTDSPPLSKPVEPVESKSEVPNIVSQPIDSSQPAPNRPRSRSWGWIVALSLLILGGLAAIPYARPDLPAAFIRQFNPSTSTPVQDVTSPVIIPPVDTPTLVPPSATSPAPTVTPVPILTQTPTFTPTPVVSPTYVGGGTGQIAFSSDRTGTFQIYLLDVYSGILVKLTDLKNGACQPRWSPDGEQIVFVSPCNPRNDTYPGGRLFIMNHDGSDSTPLHLPVNLEGDYDPDWSPDGNSIIYTSVQTGRFQIFQYFLSTGYSRNLSNSKSFDSNPVWSPDGSLIAFVRKTSASQIWLMDSNGSNQVQFNLSDPSLVCLSPAWTPDGQMILFSETKTNQPIPWLMAQRLRDQGTNQEFKMPPARQDIGPVSGVSVSPDGSLISFESWPDGKNHEIYLMTINGADKAPLTNDPSYDFGPAWRPLIPTP